MRLTTANTYFRGRRGANTVPERLVSFWPRHAGVPVSVPDRAHPGLQVPAEVNHGRWVVRCPFCAGAQLADEEDPRFYCVACLHAGTEADGMWVLVYWPTARARIEELLEKRPLVNRNWYASEGLDELERENLERGIVT